MSFFIKNRLKSYVNLRGFKLNDSPQIERFVCDFRAMHLQKLHQAVVKLISRRLELFTKSLKSFEIKGFLKKESAQPLYQNGCADMAES